MFQFQCKNEWFKLVNLGMEEVSVSVQVYREGELI